MVRAFTEVCEGESGNYIHLGATSSDIADTALALQLKVALDIIEADIKTLLMVIREKREQAQEIEKKGHPQDIQPFSLIFKAKFAQWAAEITRHWDKLRETRKRVLVGKMSGAIGTMASFGENGFEIQRITMERLGLDPVLITNQIIQRDRHAELQCVLAFMASTLEKISCEIGNLLQLETVKPNSTVQDPVNIMLHKFNISATETICNLARIIRSRVYVSFESIALEHERDLSHSSIERIYIPEGFIYLDYIFRQITKVIDNLILHYDQ
jgi:adenylosuccinate lyase